MTKEKTLDKHSDDNLDQANISDKANKETEENSSPEEIILNKTSTKPLLKKVAKKHITEKIFNRKKQGFRAPVGEWIKKDEDYFYGSIKDFNSSTHMFDNKSLESIISGNDYQKKWYLSNLSNWHTSRSK